MYMFEPRLECPLLGDPLDLDSSLFISSPTHDLSYMDRRKSPSSLSYQLGHRCLYIYIQHAVQVYIYIYMCNIYMSLLAYICMRYRLVASAFISARPSHLQISVGGQFCPSTCVYTLWQHFVYISLILCSMPWMHFTTHGLYVCLIFFIKRLNLRRENPWYCNFERGTQDAQVHYTQSWLWLAQTIEPPPHFIYILARI